MQVLPAAKPIERLASLMCDRQYSNKGGLGAVVDCVFPPRRGLNHNRSDGAARDRRRPRELADLCDCGSNLLRQLQALSGNECLVVFHRLFELPGREGMELVWEQLFFVFGFDSSENLLARNSLDLS